MEHINHERAVSDKKLKSLEAQLGTHQKKIEEQVIVLSDFELQNKKIASENSNLFQRLEELLANQGLLQKVIKLSHVKYNDFKCPVIIASIDLFNVSNHNTS